MHDSGLVQSLTNVISVVIEFMLPKIEMRDSHGAHMHFGLVQFGTGAEVVLPFQYWDEAYSLRHKQINFTKV